jgi:hypothetical protein
VAISTSYSRSLQALEDYSLMSELPSVVEGHDRVLLRVEYDRDNRPFLKAILGSEISFWDRILYFFGSRNLLLSRVREIVFETLQSGTPLLQTFDGGPDGVRASIVTLNEKITRYNENRRSDRQIHALSLVRFEDIEGLRGAPGPSVHPIRPIINPGMKCYFISILTALCASVECHRMINSMRTNELSKLLHLCFHELLQPSREPISMLEGFFSKMVRTFSHTFPEISLWSFWGQDAQECMGRLFNTVFEKRYAFSWQAVTKYEVDHRKFEVVEPLQTGTIWTIYPPAGHERLHLQSIFLPSRSDEIVSDSLVPVMRHCVLSEEIPSFIPFHAQRGIWDARNEDPSSINASEVFPPLHLRIPHTVQGEIPYILRSIVVRRGNTQGDGHYVTYIPEVDSLCDRAGVPLNWTLHDDGAPVRSVSLARARTDIYRNGYIYLYDKA